LSRDIHGAEVTGIVNEVRLPEAETPETVMEDWELTPCPTPWAWAEDRVARVGGYYLRNETRFPFQ
jgi:hypothetical protein